MTIEQLNERITQLTDLVSSASDTINNAKEMIKLAEQERDRLADQRTESEPKFERVKRGELYYLVNVDPSAHILRTVEEKCFADDVQDRANNYFYTRERAIEVADKINFLLKLERLHDIYCPDYVPDWNNDRRKYYVFYSHSSECYSTGSVGNVEFKTNVFFPTQEIAQKVCDILNAELESEK